MRANHGMESFDRLADIPVSILVHGSLGETGMGRVFAVEKLAETRRESVVSRRGGQVQSVTPRLGHIQVEKDGGTHSIHFVAHIRMPFDTANVVLDLVVDRASAIIHHIRSALTKPMLKPKGTRRRVLHKISVHREEFRVVFDLATYLMNVEFPKMGAEFALSVRPDVRKILIVENNDASLGG